MTCLTIYADEQPPRRLEALTNAAAITAALAEAGVDFQRWPLVPELAADATPEAVQAAYAKPIAQLQSRYGFQSVDVVAIQPDNPAAAEARQKFLAEHTHADFELRFFVAGSGQFYIRAAGKVFVLLCCAGDMVFVPAGTRHWFDMSERPDFCAIRFFSNADGWLANFTGDPIAESYPAMTPAESTTA